MANVFPEVSTPKAFLILFFGAMIAAAFLALLDVIAVPIEKQVTTAIG